MVQLAYKCMWSALYLQTLVWLYVHGYLQQSKQHHIKLIHANILLEKDA